MFNSRIQRDQLRPDEPRITRDQLSPAEKETSKHRSEHGTKHQVEQFQDNLIKRPANIETS